MKKFKYFKTAILASVLALTLTSCVKDDDYKVPEIICKNRFPAANHQLADLVALAKLTPAQSDIIAEDYIVEGYVSSSDESGNIYKMMFVQDDPVNPTFGVEIDIDGANQYQDYPVGALIRINLKGLIVQGTAAVGANIKIGSYDPNYPVGRINPKKLDQYFARVCDGNKPIKVTMVPLEFNSIAELMRNGGHVNQLVKINNVQFEDAELTKNFADDDKTGDRYIVDKKGTRLDLRFSNFATFAKTPISPKYKGSGSIVLCMSRYNTTNQAYLRGLDDINFSGTRFVPGMPDNPSNAAVNLFKGADFENWADFLSSVNSFGLKNYVTQGVGSGFGGGNSLHIENTFTPGNDYLFTSVATTGLPANPKRITLYVKGTAGKSLSFNVYKASNNNDYYKFNLGTFTNGAILSDQENNNYTGTINTNGEWKLIELDLTGLTDINLVPNKNVFAIKVGKEAAYNLDVDNVKIE